VKFQAVAGKLQKNLSCYFSCSTLYVHGSIVEWLERLTGDGEVACSSLILCAVEDGLGLESHLRTPASVTKQYNLVLVGKWGEGGDASKLGR